MGKGKLILTDQNQDIKIKYQVNSQQKQQSKRIKKLKKYRQSQKKQYQEIYQSQQTHNNKILQIQNQPQSKQQHQSSNQTKQRIKLKHLAIALPQSILQLPQTSQLRAYFISEVARISSIFKVDEIIILKDHAYVSKSQAFHPAQYMARNLQYLQTPQYLRKHLFKLHPDLKNAGLMNPIECQHHLKTDQICQFREGVAVDRPAKKGFGSWVDIGLRQQARMDQLVLPLTRVTLKLQNYDDYDAPFFQAKAVSKKIPRIQKGLYWGYEVRIAKNLKQMFNALKSSLNQSQYNIKLLCNHTKQTYQLPQIQNFYQISQQLTQSSILIFFSGTDDLANFVEKDSKSRMNSKEAIQIFDCCMRFDGFGVKQLRIQQQMFITLSKICEYTY